MLAIATLACAFTLAPTWQLAGSGTAHRVVMSAPGLYCEDEYNPKTREVETTCVVPPYDATTEDMDVSGCVLLGDYAEHLTRWVRATSRNMSVHT